MDVVETHGEAGAIRDEFFERGALLGNTRGDRAREGHADGGEQSDAEDDQHRTPHPLGCGIRFPLSFQGRVGHLTYCSFL